MQLHWPLRYQVRTPIKRLLSNTKAGDDAPAFCQLLETSTT